MTLLKRIFSLSPFLNRWPIRNLFIRTETTPNEHSLIFKPGEPVLGEEGWDSPLEFRTAQEARQSSELADRLFHIPGIQTIMFGRDFITINKETNQEWQHLKPAIFATISDHFVLKKPILRPRSPATTDSTRAKTLKENFQAKDAEVVAMIKEILDAKVRPAVQGDGGDVQFVGYQDGIVELTLRGACRSCSSSTITLKHGIENLLLHYVPEVTEVRQVEDPLDQQSEQYFEKIESEQRRP